MFVAADKTGWATLMRRSIASPRFQISRARRGRKVERITRNPLHLGDIPIDCTRAAGPIEAVLAGSGSFIEVVKQLRKQDAVAIR